MVKAAIFVSRYLNDHVAVFFASGMIPFTMHACTHSDSEERLALQNSFRYSSIDICEW